MWVLDYFSGIEQASAAVDDVLAEHRRLLHEGGYFLSWSDMPSRKTLREAGYTAKIPLFYFGLNRGKKLARHYTTWVAAGLPHDFNRVMLNRLDRIGHSTVMQRFHMDSTYLPLFAHTPRGDHWRLLDAIANAWHLLGSTIVPSLSVPDNVEKLVVHLLRTNNLTSVAELTAADLALLFAFLAHHDSLNMAADGFLPGVKQVNEHIRMNLSQSYREYGRKVYFDIKLSMIWRIYGTFTLTELQNLRQSDVLGGYQRWFYAIRLRELMGSSGTVPAIVDYLGLPFSLVKDLFPTIDEIVELPYPLG